MAISGVHKYIHMYISGGASRLPEHRKKIFYSSYKRFGLNLRSSYKFHLLEVPNGTKNGTFGAMSHVEKLRLLG